MELSDLLQHDLLWFCKNSEDSDNSSDLVKLLSNTLDEYESQSGFGSASETPNPAPTTSSTSKQQICCTEKMFKQQGAREFQCVRVWDEWRSYRRETCGDTIPALSDIIPSALQHWLLNYFVLEVHKNNGSEYPPDSPSTAFAVGLCTFVPH